MRKVFTFGVLLCAIAVTGCATILNQKTQAINLSSSTGGVIEGSIDGVAFKGPGIVNVLRENRDKTIEVKTPGCAAQTALTKQVDSKFFINLLSGGTVGSTTDYATKKMWKYADTVVVQCKSDAPAADPAAVVR